MTSTVPLTELHRHLDASFRPATLLKLAQDRGLEAQSTSLDAFKAKFLLTTPLPGLEAVLAKFELFQRVLDRPEVLEQLAFETVEDCRNEGIRQAELRFSPGFACEKSGLRWEEALDAFENGVRRGLKKYPDMRAGLICIASRDLGVDAAARTVEFFLKHRSRLIGLDLAGSEAGYPCTMFKPAFEPAIRAGAKITIHAGESTGPEHIWEAIDVLAARRIGHGIACVRDPKLMETLAKRSICLEICPTSNWITDCVPSLAQHPLPTILRAGVPVSINTDDPGIFGKTLPEEFENVRKFMKLTGSELDHCRDAAAKATFL